MAQTVETKSAETDVDKKIASRVMAMLARAEDDAASENEAKIAKEKAEDLMAKHSLSRGDLQNLDFEYRKIELRFSQQPGWQQVLVSGLKKLLGVFAVYYSGRGRSSNAEYKLTGKSSDLDQFEYLLNSVTDQIYDLCDDWKEKQSHYTRRNTRDFRMGAARRVRDRLIDMIKSVSEKQKKQAEDIAGGDGRPVNNSEEDPTDMVLLKSEEVKKKQNKAEDLMSEHANWSSGSATKIRTNRASRAGSKAAEDVRLNDGVGSGGSHQLSE